MLSPRTSVAALPRDAAAPSEPAATSAALEPVIISESQVMFATAAAHIPTRTAGTRRSWIVALWQRLSVRSGAEREPRRVAPPRRPAYIERAAMARAMERL